MKKFLLSISILGFLTYMMTCSDDKKSLSTNSKLSSVQLNIPEKVGNSNVEGVHIFFWNEKDSIVSNNCQADTSLNITEFIKKEVSCIVPIDKATYFYEKGDKVSNKSFNKNITYNFRVYLTGTNNNKASVLAKSLNTSTNCPDMKKLFVNNNDEFDIVVCEVNLADQNITEKPVDTKSNAKINIKVVKSDANINNNTNNNNTNNNNVDDPPAKCNPNLWFPRLVESDVCKGHKLYQVSGCNTRRTIDGTKESAECKTYENTQGIGEVNPYDNSRACGSPGNPCSSIKWNPKTGEWEQHVSDWIYNKEFKTWEDPNKLVVTANINPKNAEFCKEHHGQCVPFAE